MSPDDHTTTPPNGAELAQMLVDLVLGRACRWPEQWWPIWDQIAAELAATPEGAVVDIPFDLDFKDRPDDLYARTH